MMLVKSKLWLKQYIKKDGWLWKTLDFFYRRLNNMGKIKGRFGALPDFITIGTQKGGSTSLYHYLIQHPQVYSAITSNLNFFSTPKYKRGISYYRSCFPPEILMMFRRMLKGKAVTGEGSVDYMHNPFTAERVKRAVPNVKLIVLLRNPVYRAFSNYKHMVRRGRETESFEKALRLEESRISEGKQKVYQHPFERDYNYNKFAYTDRGKYAEKLEPWLKAFPREQFLFLRSEDFFQNPERVTNEVFRFLNLKPHKLKTYHRMNKGNKTKMKPETRRRLVEYFKPHNKRLYRMIGKDMAWDR